MTNVSKSDISQLKKAHQEIINAIWDYGQSIDEPSFFSKVINPSEIKCAILALAKRLNDIPKLELTKPPLFAINEEVKVLQLGIGLMGELEKCEALLFDIVNLNQARCDTIKTCLAQIERRKKVLSSYLSKSRYQYLFEITAVNEKKQQIMTELEFLRVFFNQYHLNFNEQWLPEKASELFSKEKMKSALKNLRLSENIRRDFLYNIRIFLEKRLKTSQQILKEKQENVANLAQRLNESIELCRDQTSLFIWYSNHDEKTMRLPIFDSSQMKKMVHEKEALEKTLEKWPNSTIQVANIAPFIDKYNECLETLLIILEKRIKNALKKDDFNYHQCLSLLNYYQSFNALSGSGHNRQKTIKNYQFKIFWQTYEKDYLKPSFFPKKYSSWKNQYKKNITGQNLYVHAQKSTFFFTKNRTRLVLESLGWLDEQGLVTKEGQWLTAKALLF